MGFNMLSGVTFGLLFLFTNLSFGQTQSSASPKAKLKKAVDVQANSDSQGRKSQEKVNAFADQTDSDLREYKSVLKQIESMKIYNQQNSSTCCKYAQKFKNFYIFGHSFFKSRASKKS